MRRLFSADHRAAVAAEAAGDVELARALSLAGDHAGAVRMHLSRAARARRGSASSPPPRRDAVGR